MKEKLQTIRMLLVVAMLCLGVNVSWAADTFLTTWTGMVGTATNSGNFKYATKKINIAAGETYVYTLKTYNATTDDWKFWVVEGNLGSKYFDCEAKGNQWSAGDGPTPTYTPVISKTDVDNWATAYNGATVTITISRNAAGDQFTVTHTSNVKGTTDGNTDKYYGGSWTVAVGSDENWDIYITEEEAHFVVTNVTYTDAESNVTNYGPLYQRGYTTAWSASDIGDGNWTGSTSYAGIDNGLKLYNQGNPMSNANQSITNSSFTSPTANSTLIYDIIWDNGADGSHNDHYIYLTVGNNIQFRAYHQAQKGEVIIGSNTISIPNACGNSNGNRNNDIWTIHMVVNAASNYVTELTINGSNGSTKVNYSLDAEKYVGNDATYSSLTLGWYRVNYRPSYNTTLKSVIISEKKPDVSYANYTVHFVDNNGDEVKADEVRNGIVGNTVEALDADKENIYIGENRYVYSTDGGGVEVTNDGSAEFTITYTKSTKEAYSVMSQVSGANLAEIASGTAFFDEGSTTAYWSKYINEGGSWYETTTYGAAITKATTNIPFTATSLDYFFEFEDMNISKAYNSLDGDTRASNGKAKTLHNNGAYATTTSTVAAGVYTIGLNGIKWADYDDNYRITYSTDGTNWFTLGDIAYGSSEEGVKTLANAIIPAASYIRVKTTGGSKTPRRYLDYMTLLKTAEFADATVSKTISAAGWATYCSPYALDLENATGLTGAYIVTGGNGSKLTKTSVKGGTVPENTGLLLKGTEGTATEVTIPVVASSETDVTANKLKGVTDETTLDLDDDDDGTPDKTVYVLMNDATNGLGFYRTSTTSFTLGANTAYLPSDFDATGETARMSFLLDEVETTGIKTVQASGLKANGYYDLQGRRVSQPTKGMYIMNGKKVVIK